MYLSLLPLVLASLLSLLPLSIFPPLLLFLLLLYFRLRQTMVLSMRVANISEALGRVRWSVVMVVVGVRVVVVVVAVVVAVFLCPRKEDQSIVARPS